MARSQAPSSCIKSTVPVRPSIVTLLSWIGSSEDFLFAFVLVWLAAYPLSFILGLPILGSSVVFSAATSIVTMWLYISYGTQFQLLTLCRNHPITHGKSSSPSVSSTRIDLFRISCESTLFESVPTHIRGFDPTHRNK